MLAMNPRTPRRVRCPASSLATLASLLAPTGSEVVFCRTLHRFGAYRIRLRVAGHFP